MRRNEGYKVTVAENNRTRPCFLDRISALLGVFCCAEPCPLLLFVRLSAVHVGAQGEVARAASIVLSRPR